MKLETKKGCKNFVFKEVEKMEGSYDAFKKERRRKKWQNQETNKRVIIMLRCGHLFVIVESTTICFLRNILC